MLPSRGECPGLVSAQPVWRCPVWLSIWLCLFVSWGPTWQPSAVYFLPTLAHFPLLPPHTPASLGLHSQGKVST